LLHLLAIYLQQLHAKGWIMLDDCRAHARENGSKQVRDAGNQPHARPRFGKFSSTSMMLMRTICPRYTLWLQRADF
jgi:hypothetical protein